MLSLTEICKSERIPCPLPYRPPGPVRLHPDLGRVLARPSPLPGRPPARSARARASGPLGRRGRAGAQGAERAPGRGSADRARGLRGFRRRRLALADGAHRAAGAHGRPGSRNPRAAASGGQGGGARAGHVPPPGGAGGARGAAEGRSPAAFPRVKGARPRGMLAAAPDARRHWSSPRTGTSAVRVPNPPRALCPTPPAPRPGRSPPGLRTGRPGGRGLRSRVPQAQG